MPIARRRHSGCLCVGMHDAIALIAMGLLAVLVSSVWLRRAELEFNGEAGTMLLGLVLCLVSVLLIVLAAA